MAIVVKAKSMGYKVQVGHGEYVMGRTGKVRYFPDRDQAVMAAKRLGYSEGDFVPCYTNERGESVSL